MVTKRKRHYGEARTLEVLEPSPDRIAARRRSPGAPWQVLPYERQLEIKQEQVDDALRRIGKLDGFEFEPIVAAVEQWRYRNKVEFSFGPTDAADAALRLSPARPLGDLVAPMDDCLLVSERANAARRQVLDWARAEGLSAHDRRTHEGLLRNLVVREGRRTGELQVRLVTGLGELDADSLIAAVDWRRRVLDADGGSRRDDDRRRDRRSWPGTPRSPRSCRA